jgi:hypothetical protein
MGMIARCHDARGAHASPGGPGCAARRGPQRGPAAAHDLGLPAPPGEAPARAGDAVGAVR